MPGEADALSLGLALVVVFVAAVARGYVGFGFSAFVVGSLSLAWPPAQVVPLVLMLEIAAGLHLLPSVWRDVAWRQLGWILAGAAVATPFGVELLHRLPVDTMRLLVSLAILTAALLIASGQTLRGGQSASRVFGAGLFSGAANGAAGIGGLPLVALFLSNRTSAQALRATLAVYFIVSDSYAIALAGGRGLVTGRVLESFVWSLPPLAVGVWLGNRRFARSSGRSFRGAAIAFLMLLAGLGVVRAMV